MAPAGCGIGSGLDLFAQLLASAAYQQPNKKIELRRLFFVVGVSIGISRCFGVWAGGVVREWGVLFVVEIGSM